MENQTVFRENLETTRTVEKITLGNNGEVLKRKIVGTPITSNQDFWSDGSGNTINDSDEWYCEDAYQKSLLKPYRVRYESTIPLWFGKTRLVKNKRSARRFETKEDAIAATERVGLNNLSYCIIHG